MKLRKALVTMWGVLLLAVSAWAARHHLPVHAPTLDKTLAGRFTQEVDEPAQINFVQGKIAFEFVGQATSFAPTPSAPLGSVNQYGYLTVVRGIDIIFSGNLHNATTALFTFFNVPAK